MARADHVTSGRSGDFLVVNIDFASFFFALPSPPLSSFSQFSSSSLFRLQLFPPF